MTAAEAWRWRDVRQRARSRRDGQASRLLESMGLGGRQKHSPALSGEAAARRDCALSTTRCSPTSRPETWTAAPPRNHGAPPGTERRDGKTIIMVTHDPALAGKYAHRTITMLDGAVISEQPAVQS